MKVIIDTKNKYFRILDPVTILDLTEFVNKHGFGDYVIRFEDDVIPNAKPINPDDYVWVNPEYDSIQPSSSTPF